MNDKSTSRTLQQQQPAAHGDRQQQQSGSTDFQNRPNAQQGDSKVEGEGSYTATRDYNQRTKDYLDKADVEKDAEAAKPRSEAEQREMEQAEREGKSHSKGER